MLANAVHHNSPIDARIVGNRTERIVQNVNDDLNAESFITFEFQLLQCAFAANESHAATGNDTFVKSSLGCSLCIIKKSFALLHFCFGCSAHIDLSNATSQLRKSLLKLLAIVVAIGIINLATNLGHAAFDRVFLARTTNNDGVFASDVNLLATSQIAELNRLKVDSKILENRLGIG